MADFQFLSNFFNRQFKQELEAELTRLGLPIPAARMNAEKWLHFARPELVTVDFGTRVITIPSNTYFMVQGTLFNVSSTQTVTLPADTNGSPQLLYYKQGSQTFLLRALATNGNTVTQGTDEYLVAIINREVVFSPQSNSIRVIEADGGTASHNVVPYASIKPRNKTFAMGALLYQGNATYGLTVDFDKGLVQLETTGKLIVHDGYDSVTIDPSSIAVKEYAFSTSAGAALVGIDPTDTTQLIVKSRSTSKDISGKRFWCIARIWDGRVYTSNPSVVRVIGGKYRYLPPESIDETNFKPALLDKLNKKQGRTIGQFLRDELEHPSKPVKIKILGSSSVAGNGGTGYSPTGEQIGATSYKANEAGFCWVNQFKKYVETTYNKAENEVGIDNRFFKIEGEGQEASGSARWGISSDPGVRLGIIRRFFGLNTKITIPFYGSSFKMYYTKGSSVYNMNLKIDGVQTDVITATDPATSYANMYQKTGLSSGYHEAVITPIQNGIDATTGRMIIESVAFPKKAIVKNWAVSGTGMSWLLSNRTSLIESDDTIVWEQMGVNDRSNFPLEGFKELQRQFIDYVKGLGKEMILTSSQPVRNESDASATYFKLIDMDTAFRDLARVEGIYFASNYNPLIRYLQINPTASITSLTVDALHPNDTGYRIIFEGLMEQLEMPVLKREDTTLG